MKSKVIIRIWGGLGNQLFQYSFGIFLKSKYNCDIELDINSFNKDFNKSHPHLTPRNFLLPKLFNIEFKFTKWNLIINKIIQQKFIRKALKLLRINKIKFGKFYYYLEVVNLDLCDFRDNQTYYFDGYWQEFGVLFSNNLSIDDSKFNHKSIVEFLKNYNNSIPVIGLHIRRPDQTNKSIFKLPSLNYYHNSIKYFNELFKGNCVFWAFSNDPIFIEDNFKNIYKNLFNCSLNFRFNEVQEFYLLTKTNHIIISNSSYSWWAAKLIEGEKTVIVPNFWQYKIETNKIYPIDWKIIQ